VNTALRWLVLLCVWQISPTHASDKPVQSSWRDYLIIGESDQGVPWVVCWYEWRDIRIAMVRNTSDRPPCPTTMTPTPAHEARAVEWARQKALRPRLPGP
jgi:hypothetical protein